jgi:hypothetical protein
MNAALAFLNGIGRDRPAEASDAADEVWMMNVLLANCSPPQRSAVRQARRRGWTAPHDATKDTRNS